MHSTKPQRILSVLHYPHYGGPHNAIVKLNDIFLYKGYQTVVVITDEVGSAYELLEPFVEIHAIKLGRLHGFRNVYTLIRTIIGFPFDVKRLVRVIRNNDIDLVKAFGAHNPQGALAAKITRVPLVWVLSSDVGGIIGRTIASSIVPRIADAVLINGEALKHKFPHLSKFSNIFVYNIPINLEQFHVPTSSERFAAKRALGLNEFSATIGTVATISPQKDPLLFVEVAYELSKRHPELQFVLVGGAAPRHQRLLEEVTRRIKNYNIEHQFVLTGARQDVQNILPAFDVMVLTSRFEGTTATTSEALATGVPVVACDVGAMTETVKNGENGFITKRAPKFFADAVDVLLKDEAMREQFGIKGRASVAELSNIERTVEQQIRAYEFALGVKKGQL